MQLLLDFLPVLVFFAAYYAAGIYWATGTAIAAAVVQVATTWHLRRKVPAMQWMSLILIAVLDGATLLLQEERFIKLKPTALYLLLALVVLASQWVGERPVMARLMGHVLEAPDAIWRRVNAAWAGFFVFAGTLNLWVAYSFTTEVWVNFKLFGLLAITFLFVFLQSLYLARHAVARETE